MELAWVILPMPKDAQTAKKAKSQARVWPQILFLMPFFMHTSDRRTFRRRCSFRGT